MIEKMTFLSITGPKADFDRMTERYLSRYEIQLENALTEIRTAQSIAPFTEENPYHETLLLIRDVMRDYGNILQADEIHGRGRMVPEETVEQAAETVGALREKLQPLLQEKEKHKNAVAEAETAYRKIVPFIGLNFDIGRILHFDSIKYSFGRMPVEYYRKMQDYVYDSIDAIVSECTRDEEYVYLVYFVPKRDEDKVDAVFASLYFEKIFIPDAYSGTPEEAANRLHAEIRGHREQIFQIDMEIADYLTGHRKEIISASDRLERYAKLFEIRNYAALTKRGAHTFYIICGWMTARQAAAFRREIERDDRLFCFVEKDVSRLLNGPPTKLRHFALFRPFELFLEMYGLPLYQEIDPTPLLALSYMLFFGFMFGDLGQGAVLFLSGAFLYRSKGLRLAGILSGCGIFSMVFGLLFGSVFGFEGVIRPLWLNPQKAVTALPLIGRLNTVFVVSVLLGMGMVLLCMLLHIVNAWRMRQRGDALLDQNGIAGLLFYGGGILCILLLMTGRRLPAGIVLLIIFGIPLLLLFLKEPILNKIRKKTPLFEDGKGMFVLKGFFELFETLLSYFSNTLSFVRIGAFAVSHAAMMGVVMMLAGAESGGGLSLPVVIAGNLFVCGMEGLIVGIQVLRLEYYELFSRFYQGGGRAFKPYGKEETASGKQ